MASLFSLRAGLPVSTLVCLVLGGPLKAQPPSVPVAHFWRVNGPVYDIKVADGIAYLGGAFTYMGPASCNFALAQLDTGASVVPVPVLDGQILSILPDAAGGWFVGGKFTDSTDRLTNLVHLLADGTVDTGWAPNPDNTVNALALGEGHLYVGGDFTRIANSSRSYLISLDPQSGQTNDWPAKGQGSVQALALSGDTLYVGGQFSRMNNQTRQRLAALDASTAELKDWEPGLSGGGNQVNVLTVEGTLVYVGGDFTTCGTKPRNRIAAVDANTGVANNWNPNASSTSGNAAVNAIVLSGGKVYVGGSFTSIGGRNRSHLAALNATTGQADAGWDPNPNNTVQFMLITGERLIVGGHFSTIGGLTRPGLASFDLNSGGLENWRVQSSSLNPNAAVTIRGLAAQNGLLAVGGDFESFGGIERNHLAAVDLATGTPTSWDPNADGDVYALALDKSVAYAGGTFDSVGGSNIARIAAIDLGTGHPTGWNPNSSTTSSHFVYAIALTGDSVLVGGRFTGMGGTARNNFAELDAVTAAAKTWDPAPQGTVRAILVHSNAVYVAGEFYALATANRSYLAAFSQATGALLEGFDPKPDGIVRTLVYHDGRLYVGGDFTQIAGRTRNRLAAIDPASGQENDLWDPQVGVTGQLRVYSVAPAGCAVYVGGNFGAAGGEFRKSLAGVSTLMASANEWDPSADQAIYVVTLAEDKLLVGGAFTSLQGSPQPYFAAFSTKPAVVADTAHFRPDGAFEMRVTDGDGRGSNLLVQVADDLSNPVWETIQTLPIWGFSTVVEDAGVTNRLHRFYRLTVEP